MSTLPNSAALFPDWKQEVNRRVAEHKSRRTAAGDADASASRDRKATSGPAAAAAARVAARYANAPSYSEVLRREARAAVHAAKAAAQAAEEAQAAFQYVLDDLEAAAPGWKLEPLPEPASPRSAAAPHREPPIARRARRREEAVLRETAAVSAPDCLTEAIVPPGEPAQPIFGNLIEFPREMVATRRVRPRRAEGPLAGASAPQLSIFELDPAAISVEPPLATAEAADPPAWMLPDWPDPARETAAGAMDFAPTQPDPVQLSTTREFFAPAACGKTPPAPAVLRGQELAAAWLNERTPQPAPAPVIEPASFSRRLLAAVVDGSLIAGSLAGTALLVASRAHSLPGAQAAAEGAALALVAVCVAYFTLFLALAQTTPGMRYAGVELCDFSGFSATRGQRLRRLLAMPLSILPLGLGLVWRLFDDAGLAWHDRLSATYLRRRG